MFVKIRSPGYTDVCLGPVCQHADTATYMYIYAQIHIRPKFLPNLIQNISKDNCENSADTEGSHLAPFYQANYWTLLYSYGGVSTKSWSTVTLLACL